jgi:ribonuclease HI / DNA polymerase III subunit epsilon
MEFDMIIYTDGACKGNPGAGGWGVHIITNDGTNDLCGGDRYTTNNRMELMAAIVALENSPIAPKKVKIFTDSKYTMNGITNWIKKWKVNGWKSSTGTDVKNADLWQKLDDLNNTRNVSWIWVRGHDGRAGNEIADSLANKGVNVMLGRRVK